MGGHWWISFFSCRHRPIPPIGVASPSRTKTSYPPLSAAATAAACVAHSSQPTTSTSDAGRRPTARRTASRVVTSSLYSRTRIWWVVEGALAVTVMTVIVPGRAGPRVFGAIMRPVATASAVTDNVSHPPAVTGHGPVTRPNTVQVGTIVWLASELMFFAGVFAMYFQIRSASTALWADQTAKLNVPFAAINCLVLVISSVWCQMGVWKAERLQPGRTGSLFQVSSWGMREWYVLTYIFGAAFIAGQVYEYAKLVSESVTLSSDRYGSVFYMATGFHGFHVIVGTIFTSYYWHFVDVVWIALFSTIYLLR